MSPTITPPERRVTVGGGGGGGGTTLPAAGHDGQALASKAAATGGVIWIDEPYLSFTDSRVGGVADGTTNNKAAFDAAFALMPNGGELLLPPGIYATAQPPVVPNGVTVRGTGTNGWFGNATSANPTSGSIIKATGAGAAMTLGTDNGLTTSPGGAALQNIVVFAYAAGTGVTVNGPRAQIIDSTIYGGTTYGVNISKGGFKGIGTDVLMNQTGTAWMCADNDAHIIGSITHGYLNGVNVFGGGLYMAGCHFFTSAVSGSHDILITGRGTVQVTGNTLENCMSDVIAIVPTAGVACTAVTITANHCYVHSGSRPADTSGLLRLNANAAGSSISGVTIGGMTMDTTNRDLYLANATGSVTQWAMSNVHHTHAQHILAAGSVVPDAGFAPMSVNTSATPGNNVLRSENKGVSHFVADGTTGPFTVPAHGVDGVGGAAPRYVQVTPATVDAQSAGTPFVTATSTQIAITTRTAAAVGTDLGWYWQVAA